MKIASVHPKTKAVAYIVCQICSLGPFHFQCFQQYHKKQKHVLDHKAQPTADEPSHVGLAVAQVARGASSVVTEGRPQDELQEVIQGLLEIEELGLQKRYGTCYGAKCTKENKDDQAISACLTCATLAFCEECLKDHECGGYVCEVCEIRPTKQ
jgi:hypothetical protein